MIHLRFEPVFDSLAVVLVVAAALGVVLSVVRPTYGNLPSARRRVLMLLRAAVYALLVLALLRPTHIRTQSQSRAATLVLLVDRSRSMTVRDEALGKSRWQAVRDTLQASRDALSAIHGRGDTRAYSFADAAQPVPIADGKLQLPAQPQGDQTDLATSLAEVVRREIQQRIVGVVVFSDGAQRTYSPQADLQLTARDLARLGIPLVTVPFGRPREQTQARDVAVENLPDQFTIFAKNRLTVQALVRISGLVNQPVATRLEVFELPTAADVKPVEVIGPVELTAKLDNQQVPARFTYTPNKPGSYRLVLKADAQPGELVEINNQLTAYLDVLEGGVRILYVESDLLAPEPQMLRRSLAASPDLELDDQRIDLRARQSWPIQLQQQTDLAQYDVYLIGNVDSSALSEQTLQQMAGAVASGKGLMMVGGYHTLGPGGYRNTPLAEILPIEMGRFDRQEVGINVAIRESLHVDGPLTAVPVHRHFITDLDGGQANQQMWQTLPPLDGANRIEPRSRALTLLATPNNDPLLVGWQHEKGRVLVFAADSTHRWWRHGFQDQHRRFWRQAMLWLAGLDDREQADVWVRLNQRRFHTGQTLQVTAGVGKARQTSDFEGEITAQLVFPNGERHPLALTRERDTWSGRWDQLTEAGTYRVQVTAEQQGRQLGQSAAEFVLVAEDLELSDPAAQPQQLQLLASLTSHLGGKSVPPEQLPQAIKQLWEQARDESIQIETQWQLGDTATDAAIVVLLVVSLAGSEWYLRKRWGLA